MFFTIDEKSNESDLSEQGRSFLNPDDPNAFVLPDLINEFTEIDLDQTLSPEEKDKRIAERQQHCDAQAERIHNISQLLRAYCLFEKDVQYVIEDNKAAMRTVKVGTSDKGETAVQGVKAGDVVANSSFEKLQNGSQITISKIKLPSTSSDSTGSPAQ